MFFQDSFLSLNRHWNSLQRHKIRRILSESRKSMTNFPPFQWAHDAITASSLRQNDVATSFWRNDDVVIASCAHCLHSPPTRPVVGRGNRWFGHNSAGIRHTLIWYNTTGPGCSWQQGVHPLRPGSYITTTTLCCREPLSWSERGFHLKAHWLEIATALDFYDDIVLLWRMFVSLNYTSISFPQWVVACSALSH